MLGVGGAAGWVLAVAATFGPAAAAGLVVRRSGGSLRGWLRPLLRWRVPVRYWVYAFGLPVVLFLSVGGVLAVSGDQVHLDRLGPATDWIVMFILVWLPGGAGEELGWRGLALDLLQARHSPLAATALLGLIWGVWHLPFYLDRRLDQAANRRDGRCRPGTARTALRHAFVEPARERRAGCGRALVVRDRAGATVDCQAIGGNDAGDSCCLRSRHRQVVTS